MAPGADFASRVVHWQRTQGRNHLPWQNTRDPYRVWLSEIMLQQTQVATVLGYYDRFLQAFPDVAALAEAELDAVLGLWSGLGYYSRARNLHRCAQQVVQQHGGNFPQDAHTLATLPGIGRSTAAAIAALCFSERVAILDANVRRVLTRVRALDADLALTANQHLLWDEASALLPAPARSDADMAAYTQGMMDLGAMLCSPKKPLCPQCPVQADCLASQAGNPERYPVRSRRLKRSSEAIWLLWAQSRTGAVWLARRPTPGVWAGLYCMPLFASEAALRQALPPKAATQLECRPAFTHVLTHKDLHLHACRITLAATHHLGEGRWVSAEEWPALGLPAPVRRLLAGT